MNQKQKMEGLMQLSGLRFRTAQLQLAEVMKREADLRQNLLQLTQSKQAQAHADRGSDDAALIAGADIRWHQWVDQRRATINAELAQVLASKATYQDQLKRAFGRDQVTQALYKKDIQSGKCMAQRRKDYES